MTRDPLFDAIFPPNETEWATTLSEGIEMHSMVYMPPGFATLDIPRNIKITGADYIAHLTESMMQTKWVIGAKVLRTYAKGVRWPRHWYFRRGPYRNDDGP